MDRNSFDMLKTWNWGNNWLFNVSYLHLMATIDHCHSHRKFEGIYYLLYISRSPCKQSLGQTLQPSANTVWTYQIKPCFNRNETKLIIFIAFLFKTSKKFTNYSKHFYNFWKHAEIHLLHLRVLCQVQWYLNIFL